MIFAFILFNLSKFLISCEQIIYPIATDGQKIYSIYQEKNNQREVWALDMQHDKALKSLFSYYLPSAVKLLPNLGGFSFIQSGQLRLKYFHKRSPKTVPFSHIFKDFRSIEWINDYQCYFSARRFNKNVVMIGDINTSEVHTIMEDLFGNALFPQKIDGHLYYVRQINDYYSIIKTDFLNPFEDQEMVLDFLKSEEDLLLCNVGNNKICAFKMINKNLGFFVKILNQDEIAGITNFSYYKICDISSTRAIFESVLAKNWHQEHLFDFSLSNKILLNSDDQLEQIVEMFWPEHCLIEDVNTSLVSENIFYTSTSFEGTTDCTMNIFQYDVSSRQITQQTNAKKNEHALRPLFFANKIYYGQCLISNKIDDLSDDFNLKILFNCLPRKILCLAH